MESPRIWDRTDMGLNKRGIDHGDSKKKHTRDITHLDNTKN